MNNKHMREALAYDPFTKALELRRRQYRVRVPDEERISGRIYDYDSGMCMGLASDEQKLTHGFNKVFSMNISGCPHKLIIHP